MRFAIVGECTEAVFLAEAIHVSGEHEILSGCVTGGLAKALTERCAGFSLVSSPEEAILDPACDAVLVAALDVEQSMAMARQASQAGCHVVVVSPDEVSTAFSFELHLLLDESQKGIVPLSGRWFVEDVSRVEAARASVQQLTLPLTLQSEELRRSQLRGVDALCGCGYVYSQVTALDIPGVDGHLLSRTITLATSAVSEQGAPPATLSFTGDATADVGSIVMKLTGADRQSLRTAVAAPEDTRDLTFQQSVLHRVISRLPDPDACQRGMEEFSNTLELMEGLEKSLRRRRTVDVHFDGVSERSAFKTQMTAIGCGVLTYLMFGLVAFLVVAKLATLPPWVLKVGRILWITPLVLFLFAQLLLPLARERASKADRT